MFFTAGLSLLIYLNLHYLRYGSIEIQHTAAVEQLALIIPSNSTVNGVDRLSVIEQVGRSLQSYIVEKEDRWSVDPAFLSSLRLLSADGDDKPLLVLGIPTVPRHRNTSYLAGTLTSILEQLPTDISHPLYGSVVIVVMNMYTNGVHTEFERVSRMFADHPLSAYVTFLEKDKTMGHDHVNYKRERSRSTTPRKIVQQTEDLAALLSSTAGRGLHYFFIEDDMNMCPHAIVALAYMIRKADVYSPNWLAIRSSYGMNGILLHDSDVLPFRDYLLEHKHRRPPDHLIVEFFVGETPQAALYKGTREHFAFKYNILDHKGVVSSLRYAKSPGYPTCFQELKVPVIFPSEAFKVEECPRDDLWPCTQTLL